MPTLQTTRGPRSIMSTVSPKDEAISWTKLKDQGRFRLGMVVRDEAKKSHADKWMTDAAELEEIANTLKTAANHVYNGTKPETTEFDITDRDDVPEDIKEALIAQQKAYAKLERQLNRLTKKLA